MRLTASFEKSSYFWLPSTPESKLPGTLHVSESGEATLEVIGVFGGTLAAMSGNSHDISRILGLTEDGKMVTLDGCIYQNQNFSLGGISKSTILANFLFIGVAYDEHEEIKFSKVNFSIEGLDEWLGISGIKVEHSPDFRSASIHYVPPDKVELLLPKGMKLEFLFSWTLPGSPIVSEANITQKAFISLTSNALRTIDDYLDIVYKINNFLCFAIDKTVSIDFFTGYSNEITEATSNGEKREIPITVYYKSSSYSEVKPSIRRHEMLFRYVHVANELENILTNWLSNYQNSEPAFNLYFASKSGAHKYLEGRFLSLAQCVETLHRRNSDETLMTEVVFNNLVKLISESCPSDKKDWLNSKLSYANELPLRQRIKQMIEPFKDLYGSCSDRKTFVGKVLDTRNFFTHYDPRLENQASSGQDLWNLCMKLEGLFQLHLLRLIKLNDDLINQIVKENDAIRYKLNHQVIPE